MACLGWVVSIPQKHRQCSGGSQVTEPIPNLNPISKWPFWSQSLQQPTPPTKITTNATSTSQRVFQRRLYRKKKKEKQKENGISTCLPSYLEKCCISQYGLTANPKRTLQSNFNAALKNTSNSLSQQPRNLSYHISALLKKYQQGQGNCLG